MKYLIFSDVHLTHKFDVNKYNFLKKIMENTDIIIINGDFWDGYLTSFGRFVESKWNKLFPLFLKKKAIYLYGNHDSRDLSDQRVNLFSVYQADFYNFRSGGYDFRVEHGHNIIQLPDKKLPLFLVKIVARVYNFSKYRQYIFERQKLFDYYKSLNNIYKSTDQNKGHFLIAGHSHGAEIDLKKRFVNSGFIQWGHASYIIIEDGKISLMTEKY